jgi:LCP family protein required for cell wall assembly
MNALEEMNDKLPKPNLPIAEDTEEEMEPIVWEGTERVNVLLMGGDNRGLGEGENARSDTMLIASFDPQTKRAHLFSVLRDTYVPIEGYRTQKINAALAVGGPKLAMKTIGSTVGLDIQYYIYTDFEGFKSLIDAIGGIEFYVEKDMKWTDNWDKNRYDINLKEGQQHLDGDKALQYVRFRHDALSDYTRTERQRNLLSAVANKMKSGWNVLRMKKIMESVAPYVKTNMTTSDMLKLGVLGTQSHLAGTAQLPPSTLLREGSIDGLSVIEIRDPAALHDYVQEQLTLDQTYGPVQQ